MKDYIQLGIEKGLISLNENRSRITYVYQKKELRVVLQTMRVRDTAMLCFGGPAGQQRVPSSYLENFDLPLPPKEKQLEIARHVYDLRREQKTYRTKENVFLRMPSRKWSG